MKVFISYFAWAALICVLALHVLALAFHWSPEALRAWLETVFWYGSFFALCYGLRQRSILMCVWRGATAIAAVQVVVDAGVAAIQDPLPGLALAAVLAFGIGLLEFKLSWGVAEA